MLRTVGASARYLHTSVWAARQGARTRLAPRRAVPEVPVPKSLVSQRSVARGDAVVRPPIGRALLFFGAVSVLGFGGCALWSVSKTECLAHSGAIQFWPPMTSLFSDQYDAQRLHDAARAAQRERMHARLACLAHATRGILPGFVHEPLLRVCVRGAEWYAALPAYQQAAVPVVALNTAVLAAWWLAPRCGMRAWMYRCFTARPTSGRVGTLLTSVFSHKALAHFLFNNLALWSVGASALTALAVRQAWQSRERSVPDASPLPQFLAFFATAGTFAALASHLVTAMHWHGAVRTIRDASRALVRAPTGLRAPLAARIRTANVALMQLAKRASLGSSGAIYAAFVLSACAFPEASISVIFLPFTALPIQWGMAGLVALDLLGVLRGWRMFDHVAHLGGAVFGFGYYLYGGAVWNAAKRMAATFRHGKPAPQYAV